MDLLIERGRLADAEDLIERVADARGSEGSALRMLLIPTLAQEGRQDEAERLIEARWRALNAKGEGASEQAVNLARLHMELRWNVLPVDSVRPYLDQVGRLAPDDDRIWLGKANLAIRAGSYDEAARSIDACLRRRPDDRPVWRARLDWAMRTNRLAEARTALKHLPAGPRHPRRSTASRRGLRRRAATSNESSASWPSSSRKPPGTSRPWSVSRRWSSGKRPRRSPPTGRTGGRRSNATRRGIATSIGGINRRDAEEMARLAERLGHRFEAIVYLTAAIAEEVGRDDLRGPASAGRSRTRPAARKGSQPVRQAPDRLRRRTAGTRIRAGLTTEGKTRPQ